MSRIIRAKVASNSAEDKYARVSIECEGIWKETPLVESVGGIPLKKGDLVFVDVSDGYENPLIIGRAMGTQNSYGKPVNGSILFESSNGTSFTIAFVKNNKLEIYNSDSVEVVIDGGKVILKADKITVDSTLETVGGVCSPSSDQKGGFCGIPKCLFTGAPHVGNKIQK